jgi:hypothetical protein
MDDLWEYMKRHNMPLTRETYLYLAYGEAGPPEWSAELEEELPEEIRQDITAPMSEDASRLIVP